MSTIIREAYTEDNIAIAELSRTALGYACEDALVRDRLAALDKEREAVFVAETDGIVTGFIHIERYTVLYYETMANILGLAVSAAHRRRGIATMLIRAAEGWAADQGIRLVRLNSGGSRSGAHEFYRSMGYKDEKMQIRSLKELR
ncbi:MAG: GNAT family N-acetyltransferase [Oscillospiraceae bacterium]|nr:GNAT family N-acetyltransferase [Oscillospiraceae bacterium]